MEVPARAAKRVIGSDQGLPVSHSSYSQAIVHGSTLYLSGQAALDPVTAEITGGDIRAQVEQALANMTTVVAAAGARMSDALRVNVHLADLNDFEAFDEVYRRYFSEPYPTRVTVGSALIPGLLIEIDAIFAVPDDAADESRPANQGDSIG